jgi:hypothetical protein
MPTNQILHWNGHTWSLVPTPSGRPGAAGGGLSGVRCLFRADRWAVGSRGVGTRQLNEALHWSGRNWSRMSTPSPAAIVKFAFNHLGGVACTSAANCWAVGADSRSEEGPSRNQTCTGTARDGRKPNLGVTRHAFGDRQTGPCVAVRKQGSS